MALPTRQHPQTGSLEVFVHDQWVPFTEYRERQIAEAYDKSIKFLRDRLGEDAARQEEAALQTDRPESSQE